MSIRNLTADTQGLAYWMEREAKAMSVGQSLRELVVNAAEADADKIIVDGWTDPETGKTLLRVSDNGAGMTNNQLVKHLSTLHVQAGKGKNNYGVGARIAALPKNPAGVTYASHTNAGEGLVKLIKDRGRYGLKQWPVEIDGYEQLEEVVLPQDGELDETGQTGTAVILHGTGRADTWNSSYAYKAHQYLAERFYAFPADAKVVIQEPTTGNKQTVKSFGDWLAQHATADGEIRFKDIAGLSGVMFWWVLPNFNEQKPKPAGRDVHSGGIAPVIENEIFDYSTANSADFGLIYGSVAKRVAILIWIDNATMDTGRSGVVLPGVRKNIPWKKLGQHFAQHMPDEIDELLSKVTVSSQAFDSELAKMLDDEWMKKLDPVPVPVPVEEGDPSIGTDPGDTTTPPGDDQDPEPDDDTEPRPSKPKRTAARQSSGTDSGKTKPKVVTPNVVFLDPGQMADGHEHITWIASVNQLQVSLEFPPYVREIGRWVEQTGHPESVVRTAVQRAYQAEFAATIIDANAQAKHGLAPNVVEKLKSDEALYTKALGFQSLSERIETFIKGVVRAA